MKLQRTQAGFPGLTTRGLVAVLCAALLASGDAALLAQETPPAAPAAQEQVTKLPPDQLDSLVAPIALYPDPLLAQTLVASTYPLEIVQLSQWLPKHKDLKDKALADAVAKEPWDPSIQSMAAIPEVVKRLADDIQWTAQLGDAFLDQQADVMDAVQRMRKKAEEKGALKSNEQQKVETKVVEEKQVIVIEQSNPEVVYVPSYSPTVVYGAAYYPYPPIYYPPYYPGTALISFGIGMAWGAAIWGGSCCGCGWGGGDININRNNNFNRNTNVNPLGDRGAGGRGQGAGGNRGQGAGGGKWQHNAQHRGGAPYSNKATANKYGGSARGDSLSSRQQGGAGSRGGSAGVSNRAAGGAGSRGGGAGVSDRSAGGAGGRGGSSGGFSGGGGGDRIGNQSIGSGGSRSGSSAFGGGGSGGYSGGSARSSSSRGSSSMGSRGGGGGRGGGGRGGGRR